MDEALLQAANQLIRSAQRVLIVSHIRPDGDALGSLLGLGLSLQATGKDVQMVLADGVPANFRSLVGSDQVNTRPDGAFDLIVALDCSDLKRVGNVLTDYGDPHVNIDHHPTNLNYARINLVETEAVATAEILARFMDRFDFPITKSVADALLFGLIADTLGFRTYNMTARALRTAGNLMEAGGNLTDLYYRALGRLSFEAARYWGAGLSTLQRQGRVIWATLTQADRRAVGYPGRDDADLINVLSAIDDIDVALAFVEQPNGNIKVSWRAQPGIDVSKIALQFGGGGHAAAAGAELEGNLEQVQVKVLEVTQSFIGTVSLGNHVRES